MKALVKKVFSDKFFSAAFWVFLGTGFLNGGNYLYHLLMGRLLGVSLYGALESLISALYVLSVPTMALNLVIVKFVSSYKGKGEVRSIEKLYSYLLVKILLWGSLFLILLLIIAPFVKSFLHLPSILLAFLLPLSFFINLFYFLHKSFLQGLSNFFRFSVVNFIESAVKVGFGIIFVYMGFRVEGAFLGIVLGLIFAGFVSYLLIKDSVRAIFSKKLEFHDKNKLLKFAFPTFFTSLALISIFTTDIVLVRHFFQGTESGYYSAISVLGKIIYFASSPILFVLFPMVSEHHARGTDYRRILNFSILITILISLAITAIYFLIPNVMINILFGEKYIAASGLLGIFGIFISLHALVSLFANFYLSIHKTVPSYLVSFFALLQIIFIALVHQSLSQVIWVSISVTFLLLISLLLYYPRAKLS